jgi:hypothetical protein
MNGKVFLLVQESDLSDAIHRYLTAVFPQWPKGSIEKAHVPEEISFQDVINLHGAITDFIEAKTDSANLRHSIAIADLPFVDLASLDVQPNPLSTSQQKQFRSLTLAAMLVLTFPEVRWIFRGERAKNPSPNAQRDPLADHTFCTANLRAVVTSGSDVVPLFDPSGLRNHIRSCIKKSLETRELAQALSLRDKYCAAIDDEGPYAFLHAYVAYKLGLGVHVVTTEAMMAALFGEPTALGHANAAVRPKIEMSFEDIFLNFSDRSSDEPHLSRLKERDDFYPGLKEVGLRIFVTAGHRNVGWHQENRAYIKSLRASTDRKVQVVYKPSGGIYNILEKGKLLGDYWRRREREWLAAKPPLHVEDLHFTGHSAPGRFLSIAERLIRRADEILRQAETVPDCLHGAILALEAQELLAYRTPTTSLEAIALRHQLETKAECMFYGVGYRKDVKNRFREIASEVNTVAQWFHPSVRKASTLNAQMSIATEVMRVFREAGQFDEEQQCLIYLRKLHRRATLLHRPWLGIIYPALWYVETLVGSFPLFVVALFLWPTIFGLATWAVGAQFGDGLTIQNLGDYMTHGFITFFGIGPLEFPRSFIQPFTVLTMILGFTHLGIFITHLYTLLSRR